MTGTGIVEDRGRAVDCSLVLGCSSSHPMSVKLNPSLFGQHSAVLILHGVELAEAIVV